MEKSTETKGKTLGSELLKFVEAEMIKVGQAEMVAEFQKFPMEVRLRALLWAALQISGQNQPIYQPVSDWGGLA